MVQNVPSASDDPYKFAPFQEAIDYENDDDMQGDEQVTEPQQAVEAEEDYMPTSPASSRGMDEDETVGVLTRCVTFSSPGERPAAYMLALTGGRDGV